jgi:hypothetical protein
MFQHSENHVACEVPVGKDTLDEYFVGNCFRAVSVA